MKFEDIKIPWAMPEGDAELQDLPENIAKYLKEIHLLENQIRYRVHMIKKKYYKTILYPDSHNNPKK